MPKVGRCRPTAAAVSPADAPAVHAAVTAWPMSSSPNLVFVSVLTLVLMTTSSAGVDWTAMGIFSTDPFLWDSDDSSTCSISTLDSTPSSSAAIWSRARTCMASSMPRLVSLSSADGSPPDFGSKAGVGCTESAAGPVPAEHKCMA